jgi:hypothetical protein
LGGGGRLGEHEGGQNEEKGSHQRQSTGKKVCSASANSEELLYK